MMTALFCPSASHYDINKEDDIQRYHHQSFFSVQILFLYCKQIDNNTGDSQEYGVIDSKRIDGDGVYGCGGTQD